MRWRWRNSSGKRTCQRAASDEIQSNSLSYSSSSSWRLKDTELKFQPQFGFQLSDLLQRQQKRLPAPRKTKYKVKSSEESLWSANRENKITQRSADEDSADGSRLFEWVKKYLQEHTNTHTHKHTNTHKCQGWPAAERWPCQLVFVSCVFLDSHSVSDLKPWQMMNSAAQVITGWVNPGRTAVCACVCVCVCALSSSQTDGWRLSGFNHFYLCSPEMCCNY